MLGFVSGSMYPDQPSVVIWSRVTLCTENHEMHSTDV